MASASLQGLTARQERAIVALINESTVAAAAAACGVPQRTLHRWLDEPAFMAEVRRRRRQAFGQAVALAQRYAPMAMTTLAKIAHDENAPHSAKVSASQALLKFGRESIELDDLAARVDSLEQGQAEG